MENCKQHQKVEQTAHSFCVTLKLVLTADISYLWKASKKDLCSMDDKQTFKAYIVCFFFFYQKEAAVNHNWCFANEKQYFSHAAALEGEKI